MRRMCLPIMVVSQKRLSEKKLAVGPTFLLMRKVTFDGIIVSLDCAMEV